MSALSGVAQQQSLPKSLGKGPLPDEPMSRTSAGLQHEDTNPDQNFQHNQPLIGRAQALVGEQSALVEDSEMPDLDELMSVLVEQGQSLAKSAEIQSTGRPAQQHHQFYDQSFAWNGCNAIESPMKHEAHTGQKDTDNTAYAKAKLQTDDLDLEAGTPQHHTRSPAAMSTSGSQPFFSPACF